MKTTHLKYNLVFIDYKHKVTFGCLNGQYYFERILLKILNIRFYLEDRATLFKLFGAYMNTSFIVKVKISMLMKWSYRSPNYVNY
jgi:hypothetical protein